MSLLKQTPSVTQVTIVAIVAWGYKSSWLSQLWDSSFLKVVDRYENDGFNIYLDTTTNYDGYNQDRMIINKV